MRACKRVADGTLSRNDGFQAVREEFDGWETVILRIPAAALRQIQPAKTIAPDLQL